MRERLDQKHPYHLHNGAISILIAIDLQARGPNSSRLKTISDSFLILTNLYYCFVGVTAEEKTVSEERLQREEATDTQKAVTDTAANPIAVP